MVETCGSGGCGSSVGLEQFVILAKSVKGSAAVSLVQQAVGSPGVYVFGELLACPNLQDLSKTDETKKYWDLLNLFAYGTIEDFIKDREQLPPLTDAMFLKLRQLTIVSLAASTRQIPYQKLLEVLHVNNVRELEDLIIDAIYKEIIQGKLDQQKQCLMIDHCKGRDVRPEQVSHMISVLTQWCDRCQETVACLEEQMQKAYNRKCDALAEQKRVDDEFVNLKKTLKVASGASSGTPDIDDSIPGEVSSSRPGGHEPERKKEKTRHKTGLRGSSNTTKIFSKREN